MKYLSVILFSFAVVTVNNSLTPIDGTKASADTTTTTVITAPTTTTTLVPLSKMVEWNRVAWCETHSNWQHQGERYEGGLGILSWNWKYYGGTAYAPHAWLATPEQQVAIAIKIQHGLPTPDQNGNCASW